MTTSQIYPAAPELMVSQWFNTKTPISLQSLLGNIVVIEVFQMLCRGCVSQGLPQAQKIVDLFPADEVSVLGLHSVFEHHAAMTPVSLRAFIHEYKLGFPIGVDEPESNGTPRTMTALGLRGTPSLILIDQRGRLRATHFGHVHDLQVGAEIATLLSEPNLANTKYTNNEEIQNHCNDFACTLPEPT